MSDDTIARGVWPPQLPAPPVSRMPISHAMAGKIRSFGFIVLVQKLEGNEMAWNKETDRPFKMETDALRAAKKLAAEKDVFCTCVIEFTPRSGYSLARTEGRSHDKA